MARLIINVYFKTDEYVVEVSKYNSEGLLEESRVYEGVKQVVLSNLVVRINRQLHDQPWSFIVEAENPVIEFKEKSLLYVYEKK
ncbi:hypothetical protein [Desulfurococcus amylolyticus]|uniref:Uncharacterized protein n=1 Tax=Desulfurococcus amylolyticus DSM 16532 TaxID=768672 RepID=I3XRR7_DESAM|nr:hypothetical protein [Desulfurococcus amylolyticus]AFL66641.1 hypothetical protein Desfe_0743 [Desulfurococcus amylolyticus DSM 16532]